MQPTLSELSLLQNNFALAYMGDFFTCIQSIIASCLKYYQDDVKGRTQTRPSEKENPRV